MYTLALMVEGKILPQEDYVYCTAIGAVEKAEELQSNTGLQIIVLEDNKVVYKTNGMHY